MDFTLVVEAGLKTVAVFGYFQIGTVDGADVVDLRRALAAAAQISHRAGLTCRFVHRFLHRLVLQEHGHTLTAHGHHCNSYHRQQHHRDQRQPALAAGRRRHTGHRGHRHHTLPFVKKKSVETADALEVTEIHPDKKGCAHNVFIGHKAPVARIERVVAVVAEHKILAFWHSAAHAFNAVHALVAPGEIAGPLNEGRHTWGIEHAVRLRAQLLFKLLEVAHGADVEKIADGGGGDFLSIDAQTLVQVLHPIARQTDDALDVVHAGLGRVPKHHHIATLHRVAFGHLGVEHRQAHAVGEFIHQDQIAHQ